MSAEETAAVRTRTRGPGAAHAEVQLRSRVQVAAAHYIPFLAVLGVLLLLVVEAPSTRPTITGAAGTGRSGAAASGGPSTGAAGSAAAPGAGSGAAAESAAAGSQGQSPYARSGVKCGPGVLQVTWSPYAPPCVPAWHGNNGGATAPGVTSNTITISYREEGESGDVNAVRSIMPGVLPTDAQALYDLNVLLQAFNSEYELYGRKVVLKPYTAQGDALQEMVGQDIQGAQEDAATAASMGAFADLTPIPTPPYAQALVQNHVVSFDNLLESSQFLSSASPYAYTLVPALDDIGKVIKQVGCSFGTQSASYAKDPSVNGKRRVFGLIALEDPQFQGLQSEIVNGLKQCGVQIPVVVDYEMSLSNVQQEMQNAISQMVAAHVTTVVCGCDPVGEIYATQAADQQNYGPEWVSEWLPFQFERTFTQDQWAHSIEFGLGPSLPQSDVEAYKVFKMVAPSAQPAEPLYMFLYYQLLFLFNGLQAAGPDLTPATLLSGFQHLPSSQQGQVGQWLYGPGIYWPFSEAQVSYWSPTKVNAFDNKAGDYSSCYGGQWFSMLQPSIPSGIDCPGLP